MQQILGNKKILRCLAASPYTTFRHPIDSVLRVICVPAEFTAMSNQAQLNQLIVNLTPHERRLNANEDISSSVRTQARRSRCPSLLTVNLFAYSPSVHLFPICSSPHMLLWCSPRLIIIPRRFTFLTAAPSGQPRVMKQ